jgi:pSer/pThr/pTyr-binding forkhead associated (FHA) protein
VLPTGTPVSLTEEVVLVGRRPSRSSAFPGAQLVEIDDGTVSKTHLRLEKDGEGWRVVDLHSTNGTVLMSSDGAETEIAPGTSHPAPARLLVGDAEVRLVPDDQAR